MTPRGCPGRRFCCERRWCGGRSRWRAQSRDPDFETCSDSCFASQLPHCCTGSLNWHVACGFDEPRRHLVVLSFSELSLGLCRFPPNHLPSVDQQGGSDCAQRDEVGCDHSGPILKAFLAGEVAAVKAPAQFFRNFFLSKSISRRFLPGA